MKISKFEIRFLETLPHSYILQISETDFLSKQTQSFTFLFLLKFGYRISYPHPTLHPINSYRCMQALHSLILVFINFCFWYAEMRLFGVEMEPKEKEQETKMEPKEKEQETKRTKKRKSARLFGRDLVPERKRSKIKKTRSSSPPLPPAPLPFPLLQAIHDMEGRDQVFVTTKILERSDTDAGQNRFFIPKSEVLWGVLTEEERTQVEGGGGVEAMVVDPRGWKYNMRLKKWVSLNKVVLNSGWRKLVEDNELMAEMDCVELWSFRADSKLCFALNVKRDQRPVINL